MCMNVTDSQADEARGVDLARNMYLPLADKLIEKYFKEHIVEVEAGTQLLASTSTLVD